MRNPVLLFVEGAAVSQFWPLNVSHPPYMLRCGATLLWQKWARRLQPERTYFYARPELAGIVARKTKHPANQVPEWSQSNVWVLDGRWLVSATESSDPDRIPEECRMQCGAQTVGLRFNAENTRVAEPIKQWLSVAAGPYPEVDLPVCEVSGNVIEYLWDLVDFNPAQIELDFGSGGAGGPEHWPAGAVNASAVVQNAERVIIGEGAEIGPQVVLDARDGPIIVGKQAVINPHTYIEGPSVIGVGARIMGGKIRSGTTIGPFCRVGGEVEASVFLGYANKYHDGFIGHCVIGEWVNLGALTTNSDLKNNYRPVRVELPDRPVKTGRIKIGSYLADHTKTGIGTLLPTGGTVGFATNIFGGAAVVPKIVPEFAWGSGRDFVEYRLAEAKQTAAEMYRRRNVEFENRDAQLFDYIFKQSEGFRGKFLKA